MLYVHIKSNCYIPKSLHYTHNWNKENDEVESEASRNFFFEQYINDCCKQLRKGKRYYTTKKEHIKEVRRRCEFEIIDTDLKNGYYLLEAKR
jgi:hypothetical protein